MQSKEWVGYVFLYVVFLFRPRDIFYFYGVIIQAPYLFFNFFSLDAKRYLKDLFGNWYTKIELINHFSLPALLMKIGLACNLGTPVRKGVFEEISWIIFSLPALLMKIGVACKVRNG